MKKHVWSLTGIVFVLVACMLLAACSGANQSSPSGIFAEDLLLDATPTMKNVQKGTIEGNYMRAYGDLAVVIDGDDPETRYRVYNYVTDTVVLEWKDSETEKLVGDQVGLNVVDNETIFWLVKEKEENSSTTNTTVFYDDQGREICNFPKVTSATVVADMMMVENRYYRMEDGAFALKFERSLLAAELPVFTSWNEEYYYSTTTAADGFLIYDQYGRSAGSYTFPAHAENAIWVILSNGNVLLQYMESLPSDATSYDIYDGGEKYNLVSLIYNTEKASTKEVSLDYYIAFNIGRGIETDLVGQQEFGELHKNIDNFAMIIPIEDKTMLINQMQTVSINNSGSVQKVLNATIPNQALAPAVPVMEDRYLVSDLSGMSFLVNGKGEMVGEVTNMDEENSNEVFVLAAGRVFDRDLKFVLDYSSDGYTLYDVLDNMLIFTKNDTNENGRQELAYYRLMKDMTAPEKIGNEFVESGDGYYILRGDDDLYIYFNDCGEEIFRNEVRLEYIGTSIDASTMLFEGDKLFYRFTK